MTNLPRDNAELLPCPFCGKPPRVMPINPERDGDAFTAIECANCVSDEMGEQSVVRVMVHADDVHRERAVKLWNTRDISPQPPAETGDDGEVIARLWLWRNFVDGKPEYWAFDNPFPTFDGGDPQTLGQPCGWALYKRSTNGRPDVPDSQVEAIASRLSVSTGDDELVARLRERINLTLSELRDCHFTQRQREAEGAYKHVLEMLEALSRKGRGE